MSDTLFGDEQQTADRRRHGSQSSCASWCVGEAQFGARKRALRHLNGVANDMSSFGAILKQYRQLRRANAVVKKRNVNDGQLIDADKTSDVSKKNEQRRKPRENEVLNRKTTRVCARN